MIAYPLRLLGHGLNEGESDTLALKLKLRAFILFVSHSCAIGLEGTSFARGDNELKLFVDTFKSMLRFEAFNDVVMVMESI